MEKNENRTEMIRFRVTSEEKLKIETRAKELGLKVSEYLRVLLLKDKENSSI